jgi:hypothetical protein
MNHNTRVGKADLVLRATYLENCSYRKSKERIYRICRLKVLDSVTT